MLDEQSFLQAMYKEQCDQARQHSDLRQQSTTIVLGISGAIITAVSATASSAISALANAHALWLFGFYAIFGVFIIMLGRFGRFLSLKHYERNEYHFEVARTYRRRLEEMFSAGNYKELRERAEEQHKQDWRTNSRIYGKVLQVGLHQAWMNIYSFVIWSGILLTALSLLVAIVAIVAPAVVKPSCISIASFTNG